MLHSLAKQKYIYSPEWLINILSGPWWASFFSQCASYRSYLPISPTTNMRKVRK